MQILTALSLAIPILFQICILTLLVRRGLQRRFAWFFAYILYVLIEAVLRLAFSGSRNAYFAVYWSTGVVDVVLTVAALRESFLAIFWPEARLRWFKWIFWICISATLGYAIVAAWLSPPHQASRLVAIIIDCNIGIQYLVAVVGMLYFCLTRLFTVWEYNWESGIVLGFGVNATIEAGAQLFRSAFGTRFAWVSTWLPAVSYIVAELTWVWTFLQPERQLPEPDLTLEQMNQALDNYMAIAQKYLRMK
jgi:hypothetical protein